MKHKLKILLKTIKILNEFKITPIVYGSFGLSLKLNKDLRANDLDLILPDQFVKDRWNEFVSKMKKADFILKNNSQCEFSKEGEVVGFDLENEVESLIDCKNLKEVEMEKVKFKELSSQQHLQFYEKLSLDSKRNKRKADCEKIELIKEYLIGGVN